MKSGDTKVKSRDKIIVALDVPTSAEALRIVDELSGAISFFKIGLQLYTAEGPEIVRAVAATGANVFLDLKLHDIPNTVARAVESAANLNVQMLTIHLSGGIAMARAAVDAAARRLSILGVTVLTSSDTSVLREIGVAGAIEAQVTRLAEVGAEAGVYGLVASPHELKSLRAQFGKKLTLVIPGVRPSWAEPGDQKRFLSPREALQNGADYLVIGRPITAAPDRRAAVERILEEIAD